MVRKCEEKRFAEEHYKQKCDVVLFLSQLFYRLTLIRLRLTACEIAERNNLKHNFNNQAKLARNPCAQLFLGEKYKTKCQKSTLTALSKILVLTFVLWKLNRWLLTHAFWILILYSIAINLDFKTWKPSSSHQSSRPKRGWESHRYLEWLNHCCLLCHERQWTFCYHPYSLSSFKNDTITRSQRSAWKFLCVLKFGLHFRNLAHICRIQFSVLHSKPNTYNNGLQRKYCHFVAILLHTSHKMQTLDT